jgi:hypothetical protein
MSKLYIERMEGLGKTNRDGFPLSSRRLEVFVHFGVGLSHCGLSGLSY